TLGERHESEERSPECRRIETEGAFKDEKRQEKTDPEKPRCACHKEQAKSPAAMSFEIASQRVTQRHAAAKPDQHGVQSRTQVYRKIANASPYPGHVKAGHAEREGGQHVDTPIPPVKDWKAVADLRHQLSRPGEHDD